MEMMVLGSLDIISDFCSIIAVPYVLQFRHSHHPPRRIVQIGTISEDVRLDNVEESADEVPQFSPTKVSGSVIHARRAPCRQRYLLCLSSIERDRGTSLDIAVFHRFASRGALRFAVAPFSL